MSLRRYGKAGLVAAVLALVLLILVSGCGGGGGTNPNTTGVSGQIVDAASGLGIGNVTVRIGGKTGLSTTPDGDFLVSGMSPGRYQVVIVPGAMFVAVPGPPVYVDVVQGHLTTLPGVLFVVDSTVQPPAP
ncbi:MAG TPA: hypothetical protein VGM19_05760 [Armatimonadota bacterium]|jgi:hypothetical protein